MSQMGTVKSIKFLNVGPAGPNIYQVETDKDSWLFRIWLSPDGKVERAIRAAGPAVIAPKGPVRRTSVCGGLQPAFAGRSELHRRLKSALQSRL